jgi:hypothetical protein
MTTLGAPVHADVLRALEVAHTALRAQNIPHLLIGGLAVCARGYPYATADVDFLLPEGTFPSSGLLVTIPAGVPWKVGDVQIDYLFPPAGAFADEFNDLFLRVGLAEPVPVVPAHLLSFLKLRVGRWRDKAAVVELIKRGGLDPEDTYRRFVDAGVSADVLTRFEDCWVAAGEEPA